tara:strand:- start:3899 stop:4873 length:975 start_codon:yes stop_codon:yes gene_type:complete
MSEAFRQKIILMPCANGTLRSERTCLNYVSNLKILYKRLNGEEWDFNVEYFRDDPEKLCSYLAKNMKMGTAQNYLSSIIISLQAYGYHVPEEYPNLMKKNGEILRTEGNKQSKTDEENKNWTTIKELRKHLTNTKKGLDLRGVFNKEFIHLTYFEKNQLRDWLVGNLYVGDENNPPLRADYCMSIISAKDYKGVDKTENYLVIHGRNKKFFHIGKYKTSSHYGEKVMPIGSKLNKVLNLYLKVHKDPDFLIYTNRGKAVTPETLAKLVPDAFKGLNKHITINLLRHIFISEMLPVGGPDLNEKQEMADKMLHSVGLQEKYKKLK